MVAWNETTQKLYLGLEAFDDFIHRDSENQVDIYTEDGWTISTDPDHSGGFFHAGDLEQKRNGHPRTTVGSPSSCTRTGRLCGFSIR